MRFSIIIPCYNVAPWIRACVESVGRAAERLGDGRCVEAVCVDDGSTDGTSRILDELAGEGSELLRCLKLQVVHQENRGLSAARNAALDRASGDWIIFLDGDDLLPAGALETFARVAAHSPSSELISGRKFDFRDDEAFEEPMLSGRMEVRDVAGRITTCGTTGYFTQYAFRRSALGDLRFHGLSWCEERPYMAQCAVRLTSCVTVDACTYAYRVRDGSITRTKMTFDQFVGYLAATREVARTYVASGRAVEPAVVRFLLLAWTEHQVYFLCTHLKREERPAAWCHWFDSLADLGEGLPLTPWFRFVKGVCGTLRWRWVGWVLCFVPEWLKKNGVHR